MRPSLSESLKPYTMALPKPFKLENHMCNQKSTMPNPSTQSDSPFVTVSVTVSASITVSVSASVSASVSFAAAVSVGSCECHYADGAVSVTMQMVL